MEPGKAQIDALQRLFHKSDWLLLRQEEFFMNLGLYVVHLLLIALYPASNLVIAQDANDKTASVIRVYESTLLTSKPHGFVSGERVIFSGPSVVSPMRAGQEYFVIFTLGMPVNQFLVSSGFGGERLILQDSSLEFSAQVKYIEPKFCKVRRLSAGWTHTCAIVDNAPVISGGTLYLVSSKLVCWGDQSDGKLIPYDPVQGSISDGWISVSAGSRMTCGINTNGLAFCWGYEGRGIAGDGRLNAPKPPEWERNSKGGLQFGEIAAAGTFSCSSLNETRKQYGTYGALRAQIAMIVPASGTFGSRITIFGVNFDTAATSGCKIQLQDFVFTSCFLRTTTMCEFLVPNITGAPELVTQGIPVDTQVQFFSGATQRTPASIRLSFTVMPPPLIVSVMPTISVPGNTVTVFGENFLPNGVGSSCAVFIESTQATCLPATVSYATFICPDFSADSAAASVNISFSGGTSTAKSGLLKFLPKTRAVFPVSVEPPFFISSDSLEAMFTTQRDYSTELLQKLFSWDLPNRTITCQGLMDYGQQLTPVDTVVVLGKSINQVPADWTIVRSSYYHVCGLRLSGILLCWGAPFSF
jgi:hypothetical protein